MNMKLKFLFITSLAVMISRSVMAEDVTAFELMKRGNDYVGVESKDKVVQIRSEKSVASLEPNIWYVVYYDKDATFKTAEVKFGAGKKMDVKRPFRVLEMANADKKLDRKKMNVDSDKALGIATINGSQHSAARKMLALHGVDSDKELTFVQVGDEASQLQALVSNSIQVAGLTPPYVFLARDKFKMNVLESSIDKFSSIQQGIGVQVKNFQEQPDWLRRLLRVKAKAARFFHENEKETTGLLARMWKSDLATATEWYRRCKPAFTPTGIPTDDEIKEFLAEEAQALKLTETVPPSKVFDFTLQRAVNRELGIKQ